MAEGSSHEQAPQGTKCARRDITWGWLLRIPDSHTGHRAGQALVLRETTREAWTAAGAMPLP